MLHKIHSATMTTIRFHSLVAYFGKGASGLKVHIYWLQGRALFNQEKSKLMQTKGQYQRVHVCFFVCTIFDSFLNDLAAATSQEQSGWNGAVGMERRATFPQPKERASVLRRG